MNTPSKAEARLTAIRAVLYRHIPASVHADILRAAADEIATLPPQDSSGDAREGFSNDDLLALENLVYRAKNVVQMWSALGPLLPVRDSKQLATDIERLKADLPAAEAALSRQDRPEGAADLIRESLFHLRLDARAEQYHHKAEAFLAALGSQDRSAPDGLREAWAKLKEEIDGICGDVECAADLGEGMDAIYSSSAEDTRLALAEFETVFNLALASRSAPDGWVLALEGLRPVFDEADMPELAVEPDERVGMEWNDHITYADDPNMRVAFMSNAHFSNERAAAIVAAVNFVRQALAPSPSALSGEGVDNV